MWIFEIGNENFGLKVWDLNIWNLKLNLLSLIRSKKFLGNWYDLSLLHDFFFEEKKKKRRRKRKRIFFFESWLNNLVTLSVRSRILASIFLVFSFFFLFCFLLPPPFFHRCYYSPSSSTWFFFFTPPFPLSKITFLNFSTFLYSSPSIFFQILVFGHLCYTPILWNPFPNFHFLCTTMPSSSNGPSFLTFHGKKYHPSLEWNDEEGLLQDPKTHAPHSHMDFKVKGGGGGNVVFMFHWGFDVGTLSLCCCVVLLKFEALHGWPCCNLGFGAFLNRCIFWSWCNLDNVGGSWILPMLVICDVVEWILAWILGALKFWKICLCGFGWIHSWYMHETLLECVHFISWAW